MWPRATNQRDRLRDVIMGFLIQLIVLGAVAQVGQGGEEGSWAGSRYLSDFSTPEPGKETRPTGPRGEGAQRPITGSTHQTCATGGPAVY
jgi:hypothetical protein